MTKPTLGEVGSGRAPRLWYEGGSTKLLLPSSSCHHGRAGQAGAEQEGVTFLGERGRRSQPRVGGG